MSYIIDILNTYLLVFLRWKDFKGRSGLREFWFFKIIDTLIWGTMYLLLEYVVSGFLFYCILGIYTAYIIITIIPVIALLVRRFHDFNSSGLWCIPLLLCSVYNILGFFINFNPINLQQIFEFTNPVVGTILFIIMAVIIVLLIIVFAFILLSDGDVGNNKYGSPPTKANSNQTASVSHDIIPKGTIKNLEVIYTSPDNKYSIAKMNYNGTENIYAIRWHIPYSHW